VRQKIFFIVFLSAILPHAVAYSKELPIENQVALNPDSLKSYAIISNKFRGPTQKSEYETQQEYYDRVEKFFKDNQTVYFLNISRTTSKDNYDAETGVLSLSIADFQYRYTDPAKGEYSLLVGADYSAILNTRYVDYLIIKNHYDFSDVDIVNVKMAPAKAQDVKGRIKIRAGIEVFFDPTKDEKLYFSKTYPHSYYGYISNSYFVVHLRSLTAYDPRTNEIIAQKHDFSDSSPVWKWPADEGDDKDGDDIPQDKKSGSSSGGCFVGLFIK
jgi:hypothetical protein